MSNGPYYPYAPYPFYDPQQQQQQPQPQPPQAEGPECDFCGDIIQMGEEAIEILHGKMGVGPKSGQPMVVEAPMYKDPSPIAKLHPWCGRGFLSSFVFDETDMEEEPMFCAGCDAKISGD